MAPQRYFGVTLGTTLVLSLGIALANWSVDPLALRNTGQVMERSTAVLSDTPRNFWHKAFAVTRLRPVSVILGTSRAESGLDSSHPGFASSAQPVYNFGLGGASIEQIRMLLIHAHRTRPLKQVVVALDLEAFLSAGRSDFDPAVLTGVKQSEAKWLSLLRLNLSWHALAATAASLRSPPIKPETAEPRLAQIGIPRSLWQELEGQRGLFRATEFYNFHSRLPLLRFKQAGADVPWNADSRRADALRSFKDLLSFARGEGIDLRLFISPVHARYLEWYRLVGWWRLFESWKQALVEALAEASGAGAHGKAFPLWDFSGFNNITMEPVPLLGDLQTTMRWYRESSHYSREHGNLLLDRVLGHTAARAPVTGEYGTLIDRHTIERWLDQTRFDAYRFRAAFPAEVEEIEGFVSILRRHSRR